MNVAGKKDVNNPGSATVTRQTMKVRSNTKGVPVVPTEVSITTSRGGDGVNSSTHKISEIG